MRERVSFCDPGLYDEKVPDPQGRLLKQSAYGEFLGQVKGGSSISPSVCNAQASYGRGD